MNFLGTRDGLVHISALSNSFVKDPRTVVKAGDIVKVKVLDVDIPRKRIALTMRLSDKAEPQQRSGKKPATGQRPERQRRQQTQKQPQQQGTFAQLFANAGKIKTKG